MNPIKKYVTDADVATELRRLVALGQKEGHILFAGTNNTGLPPSKIKGYVHYVQYDGSSVLNLKYEANNDVYHGYLDPTDAMPTWGEYVLKSDLNGINLTLAYTAALIPNQNPHLCIKDAIEKKKIPANRVVILNIQNGSEFWAIGKWHNWNQTYASFVVGGYGFTGIGQLYINGNTWMWKSDKSSTFVEI